jgi:NMD protein affecting ribosome stability and mRNA decay
MFECPRCGMIIDSHFWETPVGAMCDDCYDDYETSKLEEYDGDL